MLLQDLIDQLTELKESVGGEREVRLANQPSWPFEYTISNVLAVDPNAEDVAAYKKAIEDGEVLVEDMLVNLAKKLNVSFESVLAY